MKGNSTYKVGGKNVSTDNTKKAQGPKPTKKLPHSIFQPNSARSTSTVESDCVGYNSPRQRPPSGERSNGATAYDFVDSPDRFDSVSESPAALKTLNVNADQKPVSAMLSPSIANNMTLQALSPTTKTSFMDIENSYQNLKHKTPVNQVVKSNTSPAPSQNGQNSLAEDYIKSVNLAATKIQRKFRGYLGKKNQDDARNKAGEAAMKRLFGQKKREREEMFMKEQESLANEDRARDDRRRIREDKARQARQDAIKVRAIWWLVGKDILHKIVVLL